MPLYSLGVRTPAPATGSAYCVLRAGTGMILLREVGWSSTAATASTVSIARTITGTASTSTAGQAYDTLGPASLAKVETAWSVAPSRIAAPGTGGGTANMRRLDAAAAIGTGLVWTFGYGEGLWIKATQGVLLWNGGSGTAAALDAYFVWEE